MFLRSCMKLPLVATRLIIIAFKLMVAAIVVLSILPLLTGGIGIDLEGGDEGEMTFEDGVHPRRDAYNRPDNGYYDINDLKVSFIFMNEEGDVLAVRDETPWTYPPGRRPRCPSGYPSTYTT
jgi:preprotein translocase subunit SecD